MVHERRKSRTAARATRPDASRSSAERIATALGIVAHRGWVSAAELAGAMGVDRSTGWRLARDEWRQTVEDGSADGAGAADDEERPEVSV